MNKKVVVLNCDDCQFYEGHYVNKKLMEQKCWKLGINIHRNINMDFAANCPLEDDKPSNGHDVNEFYENDIIGETK